jgi:hypothetical protein
MDLTEKDMFGLPSSTEHLNKELLKDLTIVLMKHTPSSLKDTEKYLARAWSQLKTMIESKMTEWKDPDDITVIDRVEMKNFAKIYMPKYLLNLGKPWKEVVNVVDVVDDVVHGWYVEFLYPKEKKLDFSESDCESD